MQRRSMDKLSEMRAFTIVVDEGNFSAASRVLHVTPSAVSKQVSRLEERLGVQLLHRNTRQVQVTEIGQVYYERCQSLLEQFDNIEVELSQLTGEPKGRVRVSLSLGLAQFRVLPRLNEFYKKYPDIVVDLEITDRPVDLFQDKVDIALRLGRLEDSEWIARRIGYHKCMICASPEYIERHGQPKNPDELSRHNCLTLSIEGSRNLWPLVGPDGPWPTRVSGNFAASDLVCLLQAAKAGVGIAKVSSLVATDAVVSGSLCQVLKEYMPTECVPLHALMIPGKMSAKVRVTLEFLSSLFQMTSPSVLKPTQNKTTYTQAATA